jgi:hypothetical protein
MSIDVGRPKMGDNKEALNDYPGKQA